VRKAIDNSLCFGLYQQDEHMADECKLAHPELQDLRRIMQTTVNAAIYKTN